LSARRFAIPVAPAVFFFRSVGFSLFHPPFPLCCKVKANDRLCFFLMRSTDSCLYGSPPGFPHLLTSFSALRAPRKAGVLFWVFPAVGGFSPYGRSVFFGRPTIPFIFLVNLDIWSFFGFFFPFVPSPSLPYLFFLRAYLPWPVRFFIRC